MARSIRDKVFVITGASSGIGLLTARRAAEEGAKVLLVSRNRAALAEAVDDIEARGGRAAYAVADVSDPDQVERAATAAVARFGRIDCWVNNAGVAIYADLLETPLDEHQRMFQVNYFGTVHGARAAMPHLERSGGSLVTIGSIAGEMPSPVMGAYAASKHAIHAFVKGLRIELKMAGSKVRTLLVKPAGMTTPIAAHAANHQDGEALIPPPPYDPALVAEAVLHAVRHDVEEMTVGGIGRLQVLFAAHFPHLFERVAPVIVPLLSSDRIAKTPGSNLWSVAEDGASRAAHESGRRFSLSLAARQRPVLTAGLLATGLLVAAGLVSRRRQAG